MGRRAVKTRVKNYIEMVIEGDVFDLALSYDSDLSLRNLPSTDSSTLCNESPCGNIRNIQIQ